MIHMQSLIIQILCVEMEEFGKGIWESIKEKLDYFEDADLKKSIDIMATSCMEHILLANSDE